MGKAERAAWRHREAELQGNCELVGDEDNALARSAYRKLEEHYNSRSVGDVVGGWVDRAKGR